MSNRDKESHITRAQSAPASSMERRMDLDLDYARVRAALDVDTIAADAAETARRAETSVSDTDSTTILMPLSSRVAGGCRRRSRAPMAACLAAVLLLTAGLVMGAGWLVAGLRDGSIGASGLPPLFPWGDFDWNEEPGHPSLDAPLPDENESETSTVDQWYSATVDEVSGLTLAPMEPAEEPTDATPDDVSKVEPHEPQEPVTEAETEVDMDKPQPNETPPLGESITVGGVTYYNTGYAIPLGTLSDRLRELGAVADDRVCYAVLGLDSARYIVATADSYCYLYKTAAAPDPAAWLESWLGSLQS